MMRELNKLLSEPTKYQLEMMRLTKELGLHNWSFKTNKCIRCGIDASQAHDKIEVVVDGLKHIAYKGCRGGKGGEDDG